MYFLIIRSYSLVFADDAKSSRSQRQCRVAGIPRQSESIGQRVNATNTQSVRCVALTPLPYIGPCSAWQPCRNDSATICGLKLLDVGRGAGLCFQRAGGMNSRSEPAAWGHAAYNNRALPCTARSIRPCGATAPVATLPRLAAEFYESSPTRSGHANPHDVLPWQSRGYTARRLFSGRRCLVCHRECFWQARESCLRRRRCLFAYRESSRRARRNLFPRRR